MRKVRDISAGPAGKLTSTATPTENTTVTVVVTNEKLPFWALQRLAVQVHASMARAIQPFSTENDGDVLFAVTTGEVDNAGLSAVDLGLIASEVAWDAVLSSLPQLPAINAASTSQVSLESLAGTYFLSSTTRVVVSQAGDQLMIEAMDPGGIYLTRGSRRRLIPVSGDEFMIDNARGDRVRFERERSGRITGFTINPEGWPVRARR